MVVQTDKGIKQVEIYPKEYLRFSIKDHLGDAWTYQRLSPAAAAYHATSVRKLLDKWTKTYLDVLSKEKRKLLHTDLRSNEDPWGFFYILFKVHKVLLKTHPFVLYYGNILHPLGQIIAEWLQPLARMQKSYFQDSFTLKKELDIHKIPSNARLFICDATSMYTNIRTGPSLQRIGRFALNNKKHLAVPPAVLVDALRLLMTNNVFQFGDT